jgi:hypothetical protein
MGISKKVCEMNKAFANIKIDLKSKTKEDIARNVAEKIPVFDYDKAKFIVTLVDILSNHELVRICWKEQIKLTNS